MTEITSSRDVHLYFGLTYASYLVLPRTLLQSMPGPWQERFVAMLEEMDSAFDHVPQADAYDVKAAVEREVGSLSEAEMTFLGISRDDCGHADGENCACEPTWSSSERSEMESWERVLIPVADPVPHYGRGRTRIEPRGLTAVPVWQPETGPYARTREGALSDSKQA